MLLHLECAEALGINTEPLPVFLADKAGANGWPRCDECYNALDYFVIANPPPPVLDDLPIMAREILTHELAGQVYELKETIRGHGVGDMFFATDWEVLGRRVTQIAENFNALVFHMKTVPEGSKPVARYAVEILTGSL